MQDTLFTVNGETEIFGIMGNPVHHSLSPKMHNACFRALDMNCIYIPLLTTDVHHGVEGLKALGFKGVSVTIPHKQDVIPFVNIMDPVAEKIGAVNTLLIKGCGLEDGCTDHAEKTVYGYNTDWIGANRALEEKIKLKGSKVLVVGAGGSARAIGFGLIEAGAEVIIANRTVKRGQGLASVLDCSFVTLEEIAQVQTDVLINATSVGMVPNTEYSPVPGEVLKKFSVVMDIVYAPLQTRLLQEAEDAGCEVVDGLSMLLHQGAEQFRLWTEKEPPLGLMREVLYRHFS